MLPAHHNAESRLEAAGIAGDRKSPLLRSAAGWTGKLTAETIDRRNARDMVKHQANAASLGNSTFRATVTTASLQGGGTIEKDEQMAAYESPMTTKLYDRTNDQITCFEYF